MMSSHPYAPRDGADALQRCIEACYDCAQTCSACADACLAEPHIFPFRDCTRLTLDCADLCATIGRIATRGTGLKENLLAEILNTCALMCRFCGAECERHSRARDYFKVCAAACRTCAEACGEAIRALRVE